jgi:hypothetical protein
LARAPQQKAVIDPAIIDELMKGYQAARRYDGSWGNPGAIKQTGLRADSGRGDDPLSGLRERPGATAEGQKAQKPPKRHEQKTLLSEEGKLEIEVPWDRAGEFEPQFIPKGQRRFGGFDQKIIAMYAQGMTVREIQPFLEEQYKVEVSAKPD